MTEDEAIGVIEQMRKKYGGPFQIHGDEQDLCREAVQTIAQGIIDRAEVARVAAEAANEENKAAEASNALEAAKAAAEADTNGSTDKKPLRLTSPSKTDAKDGA